MRKFKVGDIMRMGESLKPKLYFLILEILEIDYEEENDFYYCTVYNFIRGKVMHEFWIGYDFHHKSSISELFKN